MVAVEGVGVSVGRGPCAARGRVRYLVPVPPVAHRSLGPRLATIARMVPPGRVVADVACDHGRLARALLDAGAPGVIATDLRPAPLARARRALAGCPGAETRLGDGLAPLRPGEAGVIVLAGLGGRTIAKVLTAAPACVRAARRLVLQPNRDAPHLRAALWELDLAIVDEAMAAERGRLYPVIAAEPGAPTGAPPSPADARFGPILLRTRPPAFVAFLDRERARLVAAMAQAGERAPPGLAYELALVEEALAGGTEVSRTSARNSRA